MAATAPRETPYRTPDVNIEQGRDRPERRPPNPSDKGRHVDAEALRSLPVHLGGTPLGRRQKSKDTPLARFDEGADRGVESKWRYAAHEPWIEEPCGDAMQRHLHKLRWGVEEFPEEDSN